MRTRDENKEATIRIKALEMIVREGFDGFSMQKLAKASNVSPATIYIYYENKEDMLNRLFNDVQQIFSEVTLRDFDPELSLEEGLWMQWKNRFQFILEYPDHFRFFEQFRNSPLINHENVHISDFRANMQKFVMNAIKRKEMKRMEPEVFWSIAYGPFYSLVKFHLQQKTMMNTAFALTDDILKQTLQMVVKALRP
jgi:AcrR family transcriptional regulator